MTPKRRNPLSFPSTMQPNGSARPRLKEKPDLASLAIRPSDLPDRDREIQKEVSMTRLAEKGQGSSKKRENDLLKTPYIRVGE